MQLRNYIAFARKWVWLIVLLTLVAAGVSYAYSLRIPPTYRAETMILVGQQQASGNLSPADLYASNNLAQAYSLLATQPPVLQATADAIQFAEGWQSLYFRVSASAAGNQLIRITATSSDPGEAKRIASELARQLILQSPISKQQAQAEEQRDFVTKQQAILRSQIEAAQAKLVELNNQATLENDPVVLRDVNDRIVALQSKVDTWQKNYADLSALLNAGTDKYMTILAPAQEPTAPISPDIRRNVLLAALAGAALAIALGYVFDYLDETIKSPDDVERELGLGSLGVISRISGIRHHADALVTLRQPRAPISEAYRVLRTNLRYSGIENPKGALLVTSAGPSEGKSTTAANLAVTLAQTGKRVVLVDSDLRRPVMHKLFNLHNSVGLSTLFLDNPPTLAQALQPTEEPGLAVLTCGQPPPNPAEMLESDRMSEILDELREQSDIVVLDSPPCLAVADASILGARCSGAILVVDSGKTRTDVARRAIETLRRANVKVVGAVVNKLSQKRSSGYYYYDYYSDRSRSAAKETLPQHYASAGTWTASATGKNSASGQAPSEQPPTADAAAPAPPPEQDVRAVPPAATERTTPDKSVSEPTARPRRFQDVPPPPPPIVHGASSGGHG